MPSCDLGLGVKQAGTVRPWLAGRTTWPKQALAFCVSASCPPLVLPGAGGGTGKERSPWLPASGTYCPSSRRTHTFLLCIDAQASVPKKYPTISQSMISLGTRGAWGRQPIWYKHIPGWFSKQPTGMSQENKDDTQFSGFLLPPLGNPGLGWFILVSPIGPAAESLWEKDSPEAVNAGCQGHLPLGWYLTLEFSEAAFFFYLAVNFASLTATTILDTSP